MDEGELNNWVDWNWIGLLVGELNEGSCFAGRLSSYWTWWRWCARRARTTSPTDWWPSACGSATSRRPSTPSSTPCSTAPSSASSSSFSAAASGALPHRPCRRRVPTSGGELPSTTGWPRPVTSESVSFTYARTEWQHRQLIPSTDE